MTFRYSCYLSYQRGNELVDRFVRELFRALTAELALTTDLPVYFDTARLELGEVWDVMSRALRSSVCMVPVLTPTYFSPERPYCGREYLSMERAEKWRAASTGLKENLILPVVLRGAERLPSLVRQRQYVDFSDHLAFRSSQFRSRGFAKKVNEMATQITRLREAYRQFETSVNLRDTETLELPSNEETRDWLSRLG